MPSKDVDLDGAVATFLRDVRNVYEEYEEGYIDPDAALWTIEGHLDSLEETLQERSENGEQN